MLPTSVTKSEAAYGELRRGILSGALPPGTELDQGALAQEYQISTTPIREALRRLAAEQLVTVKPHHGPRVAPLSAEELHHLFAVRLELDPFAAALAAERATDAQRSDVRKLLHAHAESGEARVALNREFHRAIFTACGNPVLIQVLDSLWQRCDRYRFLLVGCAPEAPHARAEHETLLAALESRDADGVRKLMHAHVQASYRGMADLVDGFVWASADKK